MLWKIMLDEELLYRKKLSKKNQKVHGFFICLLFLLPIKNQKF